MADPGSLVALLPLILKYFPELLAVLKELFASEGDTDEKIDRIMAMRSPEEIEADVDAGVLPEPWAGRRKAAAAQKTFGDVLYAIIIAQSLGIEGSVSPEDMQATEAAHTGLGEAYQQCLDAIGELREDRYMLANDRLGVNLAALIQIKIKVCPFLNEEDDE